MIRIYAIILIHLFLTSCIDLITEEEYYESIHLKQTGWLDFYENDYLHTVYNDYPIKKQYLFANNSILLLMPLPKKKRLIPSVPSLGNNIL